MLSTEFVKHKHKPDRIGWLSHTNSLKIQFITYIVSKGTSSLRSLSHTLKWTKMKLKRLDDCTMSCDSPRCWGAPARLQLRSFIVNIYTLKGPKQWVVLSLRQNPGGNEKLPYDGLPGQVVRWVAEGLWTVLYRPPSSRVTGGSQAVLQTLRLAIVQDLPAWHSDSYSKGYNTLLSLFWCLNFPIFGQWEPLSGWPHYLTLWLKKMGLAYLILSPPVLESAIFHQGPWLPLVKDSIWEPIIGCYMCS